jgi:DNA-binding transcriptional LysR family regulator
VDAARDALAAIDTVEQKARSVGGHAELTIVATPTNGLLLTTALSELGRCEPGLTLRLSRASDAHDMLRTIQRGDAEIGFSELMPWALDHQLTSKPIAEMEVVLVSPPGIDLPESVSWDDVAMQPLIMPPAGSDRRDLITDTAARNAGTIPHASLVSEDRGAWIAAAQAGMGSFLSYMRVVMDLQGVEIRSFTPPQIVTVGFIHRTGPVSQAGRRFIDLVGTLLANSSPGDIDA